MSRVATRKGRERDADHRDLPEVVDRSSHDLIQDRLPVQETLPPLKWLLQPNDSRFAHPAEIEFARLLTFYGIRWAYEPTTFAVRWRDDGSPEEFVTPDFYLPDYDVYLELTTMRQRLVTRKNRKFRLLRENYPNVRVRILYLRDFMRLRDAITPGDGERTVHIGSTLYGEGDLVAGVAGLAKSLVETLHRRTSFERTARPLLLGLGSGSVRFLEALGSRVQAHGCAVDLDWIELTSLGDRPMGARAKVIRSPVVPIAGRSVVVVQEVLSSGLSAAFVERWLRRQGAGSVEVCALLDREAARILDVSVLRRGFVAPDVSVAGFGLTRWREYRDLPFIAEVERAE